MAQRRQNHKYKITHSWRTRGVVTIILSYREMGKRDDGFLGRKILTMHECQRINLNKESEEGEVSVLLYLSIALWLYLYNFSRLLSVEIKYVSRIRKPYPDYNLQENRNYAHLNFEIQSKVVASDVKVVFRIKNSPKGNRNSILIWISEIQSKVVASDVIAF